MNEVSPPAVDGKRPPWLAAVIPAYNEASSIGAVIRQVSQRGYAIVVDDGSTDDTAELASAEGAYVVKHDLNRGYDAALETGLRTAIELGCTIAVTMDADGQHDPTLLDKFLVEFENGADLIVGNRDNTQRWSELLFCLVGRVVWGVQDPLCGMKGYRLCLLDKVEEINTYKSIGTELVLRLIKRGVYPIQPKIKTIKRYGSSRFGGGLIANMRICRALWIGLVRH